MVRARAGLFFCCRSYFSFWRFLPLNVSRLALIKTIFVIWTSPRNFLHRLSYFCLWYCGLLIFHRNTFFKAVLVKRRYFLFLCLLLLSSLSQCAWILQSNPYGKDRFQRSFPSVSLFPSLTTALPPFHMACIPQSSPCDKYLCSGVLSLLFWFLRPQCVASA